MNSPNYWLGRLVGDQERYRLEELLGSGGMGQVYLAKDTLLGKQVALKLLRSSLSEDDTFKQRFEREVSVCAALSSEHIVRIDGFGVTPEGYPYFVMEQLVGETLAARLKREKKLSIAESVSIITQVCTGLKIAHQGVSLWRQGKATQPIKVIHRDLKPENIFLVPTGLGDLAKILDFGIAKICEERQGEYTGLTGTDMFIGTFYYASPEQVRGASNVDERTDIYSLGMILFEMLSGTDPFGLTQSSPPPSGIDWALAHTAKEPTALRSLPQCATFSEEIEAIVMRCLAKNPVDRFASVEQLCTALQTELERSKIEPALSGSLSGLLSEGESLPVTLNITQPTIPVLPVREGHANNQAGSEPLKPAIAEPERLSGTIAETPALTSTAAQPGVLSDTSLERMVLEPISPPLTKAESVFSGTIAEVPVLSIAGASPSAIKPATDPLLSPDIDAVAGQALQTPAVKEAEVEAEPRLQELNPVSPSLATSAPAELDPATVSSVLSKQSLTKKKPFWLWGAGVAATLILSGVVYGIWQQANSRAETAKKLLTEMVALQSQSDYEACIAKAETFPSESDRYSEAQLVLNRCRLGKAEQLSTGNQFAAAIAMAKLIPVGDPVQAKATSLIDQSSVRILKLATDTYANTGKTEAAIAFLKAIPPTATISPKARSSAQQWQQETTSNNQRLQAARTALDAGQWDKAIAAANQVTTNTPYWKQQKNPILTQAKSGLAKLEQERIAKQQLEQERIRQSQPPPTSSYKPPASSYRPPAQSSAPPPTSSNSQNSNSGNADLCEGGGTLGNCP